ncbi:MAG: type I-E CRISPR-associated protein Cas5/CasD [Myxococcales bacterium]|nr:type I-E CRISPR-associated protein Cas5/CasD [Myxococcales bacterium]
MKAVILRLEGPLQAWATQSKLGVRDTDREPSKSGVLGMVGAALGMDHSDTTTLARLAALALAVRVDRPGSLLRDFHTAGAGTFRSNPKYFVHGTSSCVPGNRYYLQGASFVAALAGDPALVDEIAQALKSPRWPLYLGRRACPPATPVLMGTAEGTAEQAVRHARPAEDAQPPYRLIIEAGIGEPGDPRYDQPLSFCHGDRRYALRYVRTDWLLETPA